MPSILNNLFSPFRPQPSQPSQPAQPSQSAKPAAAPATNNPWAGASAFIDAGVPSMLRGINWNPVQSFTIEQMAAIRDGGNASQIASMLHTLTTDRTSVELADGSARASLVQELLLNRSSQQIDAVRSACVQQFGCDPEVDMRSWDIGEPMVSTDATTQLGMVSALRAPELAQTAQTLSGLYAKAQAGTLTAADRQTYFALLPTVGIWQAPARAGNQNLPSMDRTLLNTAWMRQGKGVSLDAALQAIEGKLPAANAAPSTPREKNIAVIVSSQGAQWQELADWANVMTGQGYHLQLFTPDGRPVAFQHDSMTVDSHTAPMGFGCPPSIDPRGATGQLVQGLLANTAPAASFDASKFGAVYAVGGLGFNEDVAVASPNGSGGATVALNPNIAKMMKAATDARIPEFAICHGPTLFAGATMTVNGKTEPVASGVSTTSLPPVEGYVGFTHRKERQFTFNTNTEQVLAAAGARTDTAADLLNLTRVVRDQKDGMPVVTGASPTAATNLAWATVQTMQAYWGK